VVWSDIFIHKNILIDSYINMKNYNFIEIGTSDFDTLIQKADETTIGLCIEPLKIYLDRLPNKSNVIKINCAIVDNEDIKKVKIYYIHPDDIQLHNLPEWMKGCNSINHPHFQHKNYQHLVKCDEIEAMTYEQIVKKYDVGKVEYVKIDTEGFDYLIVGEIIKYYDNYPALYPNFIEFESNDLTPKHLTEINIEKLICRGYKVNRYNHETVMEKNRPNQLNRKLETCLKVAVFSKLDWAFGRIFRDIKQYSHHRIDLYDWSIRYDINTFDDYDIILVPVPDCAKVLIDSYKVDPRKVVCQAHSVAEFLYFRIENGNESKIVKISEDMVDNREICPKVITLIKNFIAFGTVSQEIYTLLSSKYGLTNIYMTPCGVNPYLFYDDQRKKETFRVISVTNINAMPEHQYNMKRSDKIAELRQRLLEHNIQLVTPEKPINLHEMRDYYSQGMVFICLSHSEGNPLGVLESGACGLVSISTPVGIVPEIIIDGENGFIISNDREKIVDEALTHILFLRNNPDKHRTMSDNIKKTIETRLTWNSTIKLWDDLIENTYKTNNCQHLN
jgi:glycosyltransferase involved in cell wall biosynthesis